MCDVVKFKKEHLIPILDQPMNVALKDWFLSGVADDLEKTESMSCFYRGELTVCGGITKYWEGRGQLWAVFNEKSKRNFVPTFRAIKHWLAWELERNFQRIELSVDFDFPPAKRRAEMLGFRLEVERAKKFLPGGEDCSLYSLVRE